MTCKENSVGAGNRSSDTGRHNQCSASVPTCGTMRFKWDRADLVCGCPHSRSAGCGHKFGSVNPPPCGFHATAIAVARAQRNRRAALLEVMGMALDAVLSGQEIDELDAFLASEARPHGYHPIDGLLTALAIGFDLSLPSRWLPVVWGSKSDPVVESAEQAHRIVSLIMRRMNMIGAMLCKAPPAFEPILYESEVEGGETILVAHDWCAGVFAGVKLCIRRLAAAPGRRIQ